MRKNYERGLVIGKFYPLHLGHCFLIETALKRVKKLTVIVCQTKRYRIPVKIRASWLTKLYPEIEVKILNHSPRLDSTSTKISKEWAELTLNFLGFRPDVVFSSESYGEAYARYMKSKHIMVDNQRIKVNISATRVRRDIAKHWDYLPSPVRAYFAKRVVVLGAESTGTTTLAIDLAKHYQTAWVPEYGRLYYEGRMYSKGSQHWSTAEFAHIAGMQNKIEGALVEKSNRLLICDTDALATTVWHERYVGHRSKKLEGLVDAKRYSLYILTDTDIPFKQDGTRDGKHLREWMNQLFIRELIKRNLNFIVVSGSRKKRLKEAVEAIDKLPMN